jgi:lipopolysaccharide export system protein LptA
VATGVEAVGPGWSAAAATLRLGSATAEAADVAVVKTADGRPPLEITAARSTWDLRARTAHFEGNVLVRRGPVDLHCAALDVRYADADHIDRVLASGGVSVQHGSRTASAAQAELMGATGRITLTGSPRLSEGPNTLVGATIVLWLDDERATCEGGPAEAGAAGTVGAEASPCRLVVDGAALH